MIEKDYRHRHFAVFSIGRNNFVNERLNQSYTTKVMYFWYLDSRFRRSVDDTWYDPYGHDLVSVPTPTLRPFVGRLVTTRQLRVLVLSFLLVPTFTSLSLNLSLFFLYYICCNIIALGVWFYCFLFQWLSFRRVFHSLAVAICRQQLL